MLHSHILDMSGQDYLDVSGRTALGVLSYGQRHRSSAPRLQAGKGPDTAMSTRKRQYVTAADAAKLLGKSDRTIRRWIDDGKIKARHAAHNRYEIALDDLEALVEQQEGKEYVNPVERLVCMN